ncbi:hypothetical protein EV44_g3612 [Erysiphe necator]|uniref:Uncharacterized protein n=1 Tax=Uncinula necator TaxID=52586 RepID=A0A0B1NV49_UNCNE|nr:hypothetical protein EV44_g3612 [Erysiphe necator]
MHVRDVVGSQLCQLVPLGGTRRLDGATGLRICLPSVFFVRDCRFNGDGGDAIGEGEMDIGGIGGIGGGLLLDPHSTINFLNIFYKTFLPDYPQSAYLIQFPNPYHTQISPNELLVILATKVEQLLGFRDLLMRDWIRTQENFEKLNNFWKAAVENNMLEEMHGQYIYEIKMENLN